MSLDASSSTIGLAILEQKGNKIKLIHHDYWKPPKDGTLFERLSTIKSWFIKQLNKWNPNEFVIEDIIQHLKKGSGANTIILLAILNRTICLTYYEQRNKHPNLLNVMKIRHKLKFDKDLPSKEDIPELVAKHLGISFPWYTRTIKKTGEEKIRQESYDVADAIAVGLAFIKIQSSESAKQPKLRK